MATTTTNYKLTKPDKKEKINVGVINQNMDIIDTNLKTISDSVGDAEKNVIVGIQKNGTDLTVNSSTRKVNITVPTKVSELTNDLGFKTTDNNTTYGVATSSTLGLVKSGADITVDSSGNVSVNDDSHNHTIANIDGLQEVLDSLPTNIPTLVAGNNITLTPNTNTNEITISSTGGGSGSDSTEIEETKTNLNDFINKINRDYYGTNGYAPGFDLTPNGDVTSALSRLGSCYVSNQEQLESFHAPERGYAFAFGERVARYGILFIGVDGGIYCRTTNTNWSRIATKSDLASYSKLIYSPTEPTSNLSTNMVWIG